MNKLNYTHHTKPFKNKEVSCLFDTFNHLEKFLAPKDLLLTDDGKKYYINYLKRLKFQPETIKYLIEESWNGNK